MSGDISQTVASDSSAVSASSNLPMAISSSVQSAPQSAVVPTASHSSVPVANFNGGIYPPTMHSTNVSNYPPMDRRNCASLPPAQPFPFGMGPPPGMGYQFAAPSSVPPPPQPMYLPHHMVPCYAYPGNPQLYSGNGQPVFSPMMVPPPLPSNYLFYQDLDAGVPYMPYQPNDSMQSQPAPNFNMSTVNNGQGYRQAMDTTAPPPASGNQSFVAYNGPMPPMMGNENRQPPMMSNNFRQDEMPPNYQFPVAPQPMNMYPPPTIRPPPLLQMPPFMPPPDMNASFDRSVTPYQPGLLFGPPPMGDDSMRSGYWRGNDRSRFNRRPGGGKQELSLRGREGDNRNYNNFGNRRGGDTSYYDKRSNVSHSAMSSKVEDSSQTELSVDMSSLSVQESIQLKNDTTKTEEAGDNQDHSQDTANTATVGFGKPSEDGRARNTKTFAASLTSHEAGGVRPKPFERTAGGSETLSTRLTKGGIQPSEGHGNKSSDSNAGRGNHRGRGTGSRGNRGNTGRGRGVGPRLPTRP